MICDTLAPAASIHGCAGLLLVNTLAARLGLAALVDELSRGGQHRLR